MSKIEELIGKTMTKVEKVGDDELHFHADDGSHFYLYHRQDCCEHVYIESVVGDLSDLVGSPILVSEESSNANENPEGIKPPESYQDSWTWTFYKFATIKGHVDIRWYGSSNGYYSESVDFARTKAA